MHENQGEKVSTGMVWLIGLAAVLISIVVVLTGISVYQNVRTDVDKLGSNIQRSIPVATKSGGTPTATPTVRAFGLTEANALFKTAMKGVCPLTAAEVATITGSDAANWREDTLGGGRIWTFYAKDGASLTITTGVYEDGDNGGSVGPSSTGPAKVTSTISGTWVCTARIPR